MTCDRCKEESGAFIGSMFNTEMICFRCKEVEKAHPDYERAAAVELAEVRKGNMNYAGVGLPADLIGGGHG